MRHDSEDLFDSDPYLENIHDTQEIMDIYLQRPVSLAGMKFGLWFCEAHELVDQDLALSITNIEARRVLVAKKYTHLSLQPLKNFNAQRKER